MTFWIVLTALACTASVLISAPIIRRINHKSGSSSRKLATFKGILAELAEERVEGAGDKASAELLKAEIERRVVANVTDPGSDDGAWSARLGLFTLAAVLGLVMAGVVSLVMATRGPDIASTPLAGRPLTGFSQQTGLEATVEAIVGGGSRQANGSPAPSGSADDLIAGLAARLKNDPDDLKGWRTLGWAYFNTQRYEEAVDAYAQAVALGSEDADLHSAYGEALVRAAGGVVTDEAQQVFDTTLSLNPDDPRAGFFRGLALEQSGDAAAAVDLWISVLNNAPPDSKWIENLQGRIQELAAAASIDLTGRLKEPRAAATAALPAPQLGPTAADVAAANEMTSEDRQAMIRGMVDGLARRLSENPQDADGWIKLMRSRLVLGEPEAAYRALQQATDTFSDNPDTLSRLNSAAVELGLDPDR